MPLPPITTIRRGETATMLAALLPYEASKIDKLRLMFTSPDASFTLTENDVTMYDRYVSYTFTQAQSLALIPGMYDIAVGGLTTDGQRFETQVNLWKLSVLDTRMEETLNGE